VAEWGLPSPSHLSLPPARGVACFGRGGETVDWLRLARPGEWGERCEPKRKKKQAGAFRIAHSSRSLGPAERDRRLGPSSTFCFHFFSDRQPVSETSSTSCCRPHRESSEWVFARLVRRRLLPAPRPSCILRDCASAISLLEDPAGRIRDPL
jgi:hypothetical protein